MRHMLALGFLALVEASRMATASPLGNVMLPSDVSVSLSASPSTNLQPGQAVTLTITVTNNGPSVLTNFGVQSSNAYPNQIDVSRLNTDCSSVVTEVVDGSSGYWYVEVWYPTDSSPSTQSDWPLAVGESRSCHMTISLAPTSPDSVPFDFQLGSLWNDPNPSNNVGGVVLQRAPVVVPALSTSMQIALTFLLALTGFAILARNRRGVSGV